MPHSHGDKISATQQVGEHGGQCIGASVCSTSTWDINLLGIALVGPKLLRMKIILSIAICVHVIKRL